MVARDAAAVLSLASRSQTRGRGTAERQQVVNGKRRWRGWWVSVFLLELRQIIVGYKEILHSS